MGSSLINIVCEHIIVSTQVDRCRSQPFSFSLERTHTHTNSSYMTLIGVHEMHIWINCYRCHFAKSSWKIERPESLVMVVYSIDSKHCRVFCVQSNYHDDIGGIINVVSYSSANMHYLGDEKQGHGKTHEHHSVYVLLAQEKYLIMMSVFVR